MELLKVQGWDRAVPHGSLLEPGALPHGSGLGAETCFTVQSWWPVCT